VILCFFMLNFSCFKHYNKNSESSDYYLENKVLSFHTCVSKAAANFAELVVYINIG
jgi:hypothetical protein